MRGQQAGVPPLPRVRPLPLVPGLWVSLVAGVLISLAQVDALVQQVPDLQGRTYGVTALTGPGVPAGRSAGWRFLLDTGATMVPGLREDLGRWLSTYSVLDLCFIALYAAAIGCFAARLHNRGHRRRWFWATALAGAGVAADVSESILLLTRPGWAAGALPWVSVVKWLGLGIGIVGLVLHALATRARPLPGDSRTRQVLAALYTHRFSVLILAPLVALGLPTGSDLLDQLPDIERSWADPGGTAHLVWAGAVTVVTAFALFVLGRLRSHVVALRTGHPVPLADVRPVLWIWLVCPVLLLAGALSVMLLGGDIGWGRLAIFTGLPLTIGASSALIRRGRATFLPDGDAGWTLNPAYRPAPPGMARALWRKQKPTASPALAETTTLLGDTLAAALFVLPGLGLVRSLTAVVALGEAGPKHWLLLCLGVLIVGLGWPAAHVLQRSLAGGAGTSLGNRVTEALRSAHERRSTMPLAAVRQRAAAHLDWWRATLTPGVRVRSRNRVAVAVLILSIAATVGLGGFTEGVAGTTGALGALLLALSVLVGLLGSIIVILQDGGAPEVFWTPGIRMSSAPVTTLLVLAGLLATTLGGGADVHGIRTLATGPNAGTRSSLATAFTAWVEQPHCTVPTDGPFRLRPVLLFAAEGGGIRAAAWTAQTLDLLARDARRGAVACRDALMSSGASGGAVGLVVADTVPATASARGVYAMAGPDALGSASIGLVLTDTVYAATGIPLLTRSGGSWRWVDRAGHMELAWEQAVPGLERPFLSARRGERVGGGLVLNATSSTTMCRALVAQMSTQDRPPTGACTLSGQPPRSTDLVSLIDGCSQHLARSSAALLSARFPFVTPSGVVCGGADGRAQQIIDGGYLENTGIGTIVDLAPQWLPALRAHNDAVAARMSGELLVPVLVYLDNGTGSDLAAPPGHTQLEFLVPIKGLLGQASLSQTDALLRRAEDTFALDQILTTSARSIGAGHPDPAAEAIRDWRPRVVHVVYQGTEPGIAVPLGWVLSQPSEQRLRVALSAVSGGNDPCVDPPALPLTLTQKGYLGLAELRCGLSQRVPSDPGMP